MEIKSETRIILCEDREISYILTRKPVKNINLRIKSNGIVSVSSNDNISSKDIDDFIIKKRKYIISALDKFEEKRRLEETYYRKYVSGENYTLLGRSLRLIVEEKNEEGVFEDGVFVYLRVKDKSDFRHKKRIMTNWIREYQKEEFMKICRNIYKKFIKYDIVFPDIKIRYMTSRWGTCHTQKQVITLNSKLIEAPIYCIEYVVLHEFVHFIYPNHSKEFWNFVTMMMPDWKERKKKLEKLI